MWSSMTSSGFPQNFEEAVERIKNPGDDEEFAFIGEVLFFPQNLPLFLTI